MAEFFLGAALMGLFLMFSGVTLTYESIEKVAPTCEHNEGVKNFNVDFFDNYTVKCNNGAIFEIDRKSK
ncbi:hypothetical protein vBPaerPsIn_74 [Pseudomonas phage vB_Paer_PsIn]|uniref:Uncharacterized protein n=1 Tax=Pseudomonas phage vB_Paer_PsIn TaxID=2924907 RepID=A0AAE9GS51_9CAUD|nr:hypothetical protein QE348_gp074 [Pseudomonas phage vB_Paer_PsIn]UOL48102.1 hypothetical protein vBPaerPsIn_74 [Pseudomonas phage vB_Paer_PsIn]